LNIITDPEIVGPWVCEKTKQKWIPGEASAIGKLKDGVLVAGVLYDEFNGVNVHSHIRFEPNSLTREFLGLIYQYPFFQLKVNRITGIVASTNRKAIELDLSMGFEPEAVLKGAQPDGDTHILVMWKEKCRYLDDKYGRFFVKYR